MDLSFTPLHEHFAAEVSDVDLRQMTDRVALETIRQGMDRYAVLVFRNQLMDGGEQLAFSQRFDGELHRKTSVSYMTKNRFGDEALGDISNVDEAGGIQAANDRRRMANLGNRLWHTDASFVDPPGRYSMLIAKVVPPVPSDTEFADMRAAYDALDDQRKAQLEALRVHHSIAYSRSVLGFRFSPEEEKQLQGAEQPLVRTIPGSGRKSLYLASHASHVVDWPVPEGRLLLRDLMEHATQREFVYRHRWRVDDFVIWDNRATMHRATPFDDGKYRRELRRSTTLDVPFAPAMS